MAKKIKKTEQAVFSFRHRAVCEDDRFKSDWTEDISIAQKAARDHRKEPGNEDHIIRIVTEQTISTLFKEL